MPIADSNGDGIIDLLDVQVVVDGYGQTTDIYEGLWDGSRLLSVAAGAAGFGSTANISGNPFGGTDFGGGRRPIDDCNRSTTPPDTPGSLVPSLLREDAERSCNECPDFDDDPTCYECDEPKGVSGGSVNASPEQPLLDDVVTFSVEGVSETPGLWKCIEACGDDGKTEEIPPNDPQFISYIWQVITRNADGSWPDEADPNNPDPDNPYNGWQPGQSINVSGGVCVEKKAICWAKPSGPCPDPDWTRIGEKSVKWATFTLCYETAVPSPMGVYQRTSIGIRETVNIYATAAVSWTVFGPDDEYFESTGSQISFTAGWTEGSYTVLAEKNDCERELTFNAVAPTGIRGDRRVGRERHVSGTPSAGLAFCVTVLPESVSFSGLLISEGELADANTRTGVFADDLFDGSLGMLAGKSQ